MNKATLRQKLHEIEENYEAIFNYVAELKVSYPDGDYSKCDDCLNVINTALFILGLRLNTPDEPWIPF